MIRHRDDRGRIRVWAEFRLSSKTKRVGAGARLDPVITLIYHVVYHVMSCHVILRYRDNREKIRV